ncbi:chymotrypsin-like elastase family member 1 [Littorina saxatilis]|uniref:Peptidase S1 domain-containing protein n=1 Tax=Littorina saxatilis TaxID=31220 RepID=A0AAN9ALL9_9CAEN
MLSLFFALLVAVANANDVSQHIVNGDVATPHSYPSQLSLQSGTSHICGAVLVRANYAITAAHCVGGSGYRVQCGAHNIAVSESTRQTISVAAITIHPSYNPNSQRPAFPNDIAVLRLASSFSINSQCQLANLPSGSGDFGNQASMITGWGRLYGNGPLPSQLKEGQVTVLTHATCSGSYWGSTVNANYHLCVKDLGDRIYGACNGDSGGPAHVGNTVVGLASFVASGCLTNRPSAYVRVSYYRSWIDSTINSMG